MVDLLQNAIDQLINELGGPDELTGRKSKNVGTEFEIRRKKSARETLKVFVKASRAFEG